ncbi:MAG: OmpA family protein [Desulfobacterales bacterium]|nr:MAG: OmpA family protein [Desulfobacterales bacterium]
MRTVNRLGILVMLTAAGFLMGACAASQSQLERVPLTENPVEVVNSFDNEIANGLKNQLNVLSPTWFEKAETSLREAKKGLDSREEISDILQNVTRGRKHLSTAEEMAKLSRTALRRVIKSRDLARAAGATKLDDYGKAEEQFLALTRAIEEDNLRSAQRNEEKVSKAFQELELRAIKVQTIGKVRQLIAQAEEEGVKKLAPESLALAQAKLKAADAFITENPYEREKMSDMAQDALFNAQRALEIAKQSQKIRGMDSEQIAVWLEDILHRTTGVLNAPDMRNESFDIQVENILGSIKALQLDRAHMILKTEELQADRENLKKQILALETKTREEATAKESLEAERQAAEERLAAERRFNQKFVEIQHYFQPDEAEVYKQGNQLVIRLRAVQFPVGKEVIMPHNYPLLSQVQRSIRTFDKPSVTIEGHTDSTGSDEVNAYLSQKRADAVREYLIANETLPAKDIVAVGYGSKRPLASNATAEGRAVNRRIDVIVKPQVPAAQ